MTWFQLPQWLWMVWMFVLGAIAGSFLNVCIHRIPQQDELWPALRGLWSPPSRCPRCRTTIAWYDNIPIVSWLWLGRRCRTCSMAISWRYPAIELLNALLFVVVYWAEVPTGWAVSVDQSCLYAEQGPQVVPGLGNLSTMTFLHLRYFYHLVLIESLLVASVIDLDRREIPDASTLPALAIGLLGALVVGRVHLVPLWTQNPGLIESFLQPFWPQARFAEWPRIPAWFTTWPHLHGLAVSVAGLVVGAGLTWLVRLLGRLVLGREAMGFGDVILMAVIGAFLGWQASVLVFFIAPALALVLLPVLLFVHRDRYIPYGPYLSAAALVAILSWRRLWGGFGNWGGAQRIFELGPLLPMLAFVMMVLFAMTLLVVERTRRLFGGSVDDEFLLEWTAADQAHFQAGERTDRHCLRWPSNDWPGAATSRGSLQHERWRREGLPGAPSWRWRTR